MPLHNQGKNKEERVILQLWPAVLLPSRRGLHWAPMARKELSVELGHNTWPYLYMRTRLILFAYQCNQNKPSISNFPVTERNDPFRQYGESGFISPSVFHWREQQD